MMKEEDFSVRALQGVGPEKEVDTSKAAGDVESPRPPEVETTPSLATESEGPTKLDHGDEPEPDMDQPPVDATESKDPCVMENVDLSPHHPTSSPADVSSCATPSPTSHAVESVVPTSMTEVSSPPQSPAPLPAHDNNHADSGKFYTVDLTPSTASARSPLASLTFHDRMRRWIQRALVTTGRATPSADDYFVQQKDRFLGLLRHVQAVQSSLQRHRTVLGQFAASASQLGIDVGCIVEGAAVDDAFTVATTQQDTHLTDADAVLAGVVRILDDRIRHMRSMEELFLRRANLKLDVDSFQRRLDARKGRGDTSTLEAQTVEARMAMDTCSLQLYRVFAKYEAERHSLLHTELNMVRQVLHAMYIKNAALTAPPSNPANATSQKSEEELFGKMRDRGLTTKQGPATRA